MKNLIATFIMMFSFTCAYFISVEVDKLDKQVAKDIGECTVVSIGHPDRHGNVNGMVQSKKYLFEYELGDTGWYKVGSKITITKPPRDMSYFVTYLPVVFLFAMIVPAACLVYMMAKSIVEN